MSPAPGHARPTRSELLHDAESWFTRGAVERRAARAARECVECHTPLASRRTPYCSRRCRWKYHGHFFWDAARMYVLRRDRFTCRACGRRGRKRDFDVDHIREIASGGPSLSYDNLQTLCKDCHRSKTASFLRSRWQRVTLPIDPDDLPEWFPAE